MTDTEFETRFCRVMDLVSKMRGWQKEKEKRRFLPDWDMKRLRYLEREVDKMVDAEMKRLTSKQKELFTKQ